MIATMASADHALTRRRLQSTVLSTVRQLTSGATAIRASSTTLSGAATEAK